MSFQLFCITASVVVGVGTLVTLTIRQSRNEQRAIKRGRLLNRARDLVERDRYLSKDPRAPKSYWLKSIIGGLVDCVITGGRTLA